MSVNLSELNVIESRVEEEGLIFVVLADARQIFPE